MVGLIVLPVGIGLQLQDAIKLWQSMGLAVLGAGVFYLGFLVQPRP
jgi:hypothetical protein